MCDSLDKHGSHMQLKENWGVQGKFHVRQCVASNARSIFGTAD